MAQSLRKQKVKITRRTGERVRHSSSSTPPDVELELGVGERVVGFDIRCLNQFHRTRTTFDWEWTATIEKVLP